MGVVYLFRPRAPDDVLSAHAKLQLMAADRNQMPDDPPPFLGSWRNVYIGILIYLALLIVSFYVFTQAFS
jgi:hypothetical protein